MNAEEFVDRFLEEFVGGEKMQFVIVKHEGDSGKYLFTVPEGRNLKMGDRVVCNTQWGKSYGTCATNSFGVPKSHIERICAIWGTQECRLQPVIGVLEEELWDEDMPV